MKALPTPNVVHCKREPFDVYIGRPSKWGNPFSHIQKGTLAQYVVADREQAVQRYREWILKGEGKHLLRDLHELRGKTLGCWCSPLACHGDVLLELANAPLGGEISIPPSILLDVKITLGGIEF